MRTTGLHCAAPGSAAWRAAPYRGLISSSTRVEGLSVTWLWRSSGSTVRLYGRDVSGMVLGKSADLIPTLLGLAGIDVEEAHAGVADHDEAHPLPSSSADQTSSP